MVLACLSSGRIRPVMLQLGKAHINATSASGVGEGSLVNKFISECDNEKNYSPYSI